MNAGRAGAGALIVGGSSGIGLETALVLASDGVGRIALSGRDPARLAAAVERVRRVGDASVIGVPFDAADPTAAAAGIAEVDERIGGIDILVGSVASDATPTLLHEIAPEAIGTTLLAQALPPLLVTRLVLPLMYERGRGSIVLVSSDAAKVATPGESVIGGAMAAIVMFARTVAVEAKRHGVRINTVTPSLVEGTPTAERLTAGGFSAKLFAAARKSAELGPTHASDVAELIAFLAGPGSALITGQAVSINGGISAA